MSSLGVQESYLTIFPRTGEPVIIKNFFYIGLYLKWFRDVAEIIQRLDGFFDFKYQMRSRTWLYTPELLWTFSIHQQIIKDI